MPQHTIRRPAISRPAARRASHVCAALLPLSLLAACAPASSPAAPHTLVFAVPTLPATLAPLEAVDIVSRWAVELTYDGLVDVNDRLNIVPALAERWDVASDGLSYTFTVRSGVLWQDGLPVTAPQLAETFRAILDPAARLIIPRADYQAIAAVETPDNRTLILRLRSPDSSLLSKLTLGLPRWQDGKPANMGTGPFTLSQSDSQGNLIFSANPAYFGGPPGIATLIWQAIPDSSAQLLGLRNGTVDAAQVASPADADRLTASGAFAVYPVTGGNVQVSLRVTEPPLNDPRVRQALALALDRQTMITGLLAGRGALSAGDILPDSWAFSPVAARYYPYDPAGAADFLGRAGWLPGGDGIMEQFGRRLAFTLLVDAGDQLRREVALVLRQQWRQAGADIDIIVLERNAVVMDRVLKGQFQAALLQTSVRADPDLSRRFHSRSITQGQNFLGYANPALDALLDSALAASSQADRAVLYARAQLILAEDVPQINLFYPTVVFVFPKDLSGVRPSAASPFWNAQEWGRP